MRQEDNNMLADLRRRLNVFATGSDGQTEGSVVRRSSLFLAGLSWRTWAFVAVAAALIAGAAARYHDAAEAGVVAIYIAVLVACAATDLATFRVPNVITYPAAVLALARGRADARRRSSGGADRSSNGHRLHGGRADHLTRRDGPRRRQAGYLRRPGSGLASHRGRAATDGAQRRRRCSRPPGYARQRAQRPDSVRPFYIGSDYCRHFVAGNGLRAILAGG